MIAGLFTSLTSIGGVETVGRQVAAALSKMAASEGSDCAFLSLNDAVGGHEFSVAGANVSFRGFARHKAAFLSAAMQLAMCKPKLIHAGHPNLGPIASAMKFLARDARVVIGAHGIEVWRPLSFMRRSALRRADIIFAPSSHTMLKTSQIQGAPEGRICKLPWPLDPEFLELANLSEELPLPQAFPRGKVILSVGRWSADERYKGANLLIHALPGLSRRFSDVHLVLVGPGDDVPRLKSEAGKSGASTCVHFLGSVSRRELAACYANSRVFALPSTGEGFGLVFLEAMAFGKPVVGANAGGIPDVVEHGREGLLVTPTDDAVFDALAQLISNPMLQKEFGERGRERVHTEFSFDCFQQHLLTSLGTLFMKPQPQVELAAQ